MYLSLQQMIWRISARSPHHLLTHLAIVANDSKMLSHLLDFESGKLSEYKPELNWVLKSNYIKLREILKVTSYYGHVIVALGN
jgi:hypothetical protein